MISKAAEVPIEKVCGNVLTDLDAELCLPEMVYLSRASLIYVVTTPYAAGVFGAS